MFKKLLENPRLYMFFETVVGAVRTRRLCIQQYLAIPKGARILDIGCGPGYVAAFVPQSTYVGYDVERKYIEYAQRRYSLLGTFNHSEYNRQELKKYEPFDFVMMNGLLHHVDDATGLDLLQLAMDSLKPGGKVLCIDGGLYPKQNVFARYVLKEDRGKFVRSPEAYEKLAVDVFGQANVKTDLRKDLFYIPYSLVIMVLEKAKA
jgi:2-polyprenyl-3-methyl-5-hydroxy-6-metoxy-1,4-benzoquinol methylase